jgi:sialic acid synthase SpsE
LKVGDVLTSENLRAIRPGHGLPPKHYEALLGKSVKCNVARGTPVTWDILF